MGGWITKYLLHRALERAKAGRWWNIFAESESGGVEEEKKNKKNKQRKVESREEERDSCFISSSHVYYVCLRGCECVSVCSTVAYDVASYCSLVLFFTLPRERLLSVCWFASFTRNLHAGKMDAIKRGQLSRAGGEDLRERETAEWHVYAVISLDQYSHWWFDCWVVSLYH